MKYYIYTHAINGVVFYIGSNWKSGIQDRAYVTKSGQRTKKWNEYVKSNGSREKVDIKIIERFDDRLECLNREYELIEIYHEKGLAFISQEGVKGSKNPMYGKRGKDSPNYGKVRTEEHRKNYSEAAKRRRIPKKCANCEKDFIARAPNGKYCKECPQHKRKKQTK